MPNTLKDITLEIHNVDTPERGPSAVGVVCPDHQEVNAVKVWDASPKVWRSGNVLKATIYEREYEGAVEWHLSKYGVVKVVSANGDISPVEPQEPARTPTSSNGSVSRSGGPSMGQQSASKKDKTITALAIVKEVIGIGGSEELADQWIAYVERKVNE